MVHTSKAAKLLTCQPVPWSSYKNLQRWEKGGGEVGLSFQDTWDIPLVVLPGADSSSGDEMQDCMCHTGVVPHLLHRPRISPDENPGKSGSDKDTTGLQGGDTYSDALQNSQIDSDSLNARSSVQHMFQQRLIFASFDDSAYSNESAARKIRSLPSHPGNILPTK